MSGRYALATISLDDMPGGLERNFVSLANAMARRGHTVSLITFDQQDARSFYPINNDVRWHKVGVSRPHGPIGFADRLRLIWAIRAALKDARASVVVCFHHGILVRFVLATFFTGIRLIVSERNSLTLYNHLRKSKWNLNFLFLFFADYITVQFPRYVREYPRILRPRISAIPNPVSNTGLMYQAGHRLGSPWGNSPTARSRPPLCSEELRYPDRGFCRAGATTSGMGAGHRRKRRSPGTYRRRYRIA